MLFFRSRRRVDRIVGDLLSPVAGPILVVGRVHLAKTLAEARPEVTLVSPRRKPPRGFHGTVLSSTAGLFRQSAVVSTNLADASPMLAPNGLVVIVGEGPREDTTQAFLLAGLVDIEQQVVGRIVITSGKRVVNLAAAPPVPPAASPAP